MASVPRPIATRIHPSWSSIHRHLPPPPQQTCVWVSLQPEIWGLQNSGPAQETRKLDIPDPDRHATIQATPVTSTHSPECKTSHAILTASIPILLVLPSDLSVATDCSPRCRERSLHNLRNIPSLCLYKTIAMCPMHGCRKKTRDGYRPWWSPL